MALTEVPISKGTFKIFIGRLNEGTTPKDLRTLFEKYGTVVECDVVKNFGFVHMENESAGIEAIRHLNNTTVNGAQIKVEASRSRKILVGTTVKIFVGNLPVGTKPNEVRELFAPYGNVMECDLVHNYGFVHIETPDASKLLNELNGYELNGSPIKVQMSTSRVRQRPGMGNPQQCYNVTPTGYPLTTPSVTATVPTVAATYAEPVPISRPMYTRDVYQAPPPPTTAAYIPRDRVFSYSVPPVMHDAYVGMEMYDRYYDPSVAAAAAAVANVNYDSYNNAALSLRHDMVNRGTLPPATTASRPEYDMFNRRSPQPAATRYPPPPTDPHVTAAAAAAAAAAAVTATAMYDEYGRVTAPPPPAATSYDYLDGRIGTTAGIYDEYLGTNNVLTAPPAPPPPSIDPYDTERRDGMRSSTRYAPY